MAMNNWGGSKEHMTKKPRKFFGSKRAKRPFDKNSLINLNEEKLDQADKAKKKSIQKQIILYLVFFGLIILGVLLMLKN